VAEGGAVDKENIEDNADPQPTSLGNSETKKSKKGASLDGNRSKSNFSIKKGSLKPTQTIGGGPYVGALDQKDLQLMQMTQANEQLKVRVKQLSQALETSLLQRQQSHQVILQQQQEMEKSNDQVDGIDSQQVQLINNDSQYLNISPQIKTSMSSPKILAGKQGLSEYNETRYDSLQKMVREKDREVQHYLV